MLRSVHTFDTVPVKDLSLCQCDGEFHWQKTSVECQNFEVGGGGGGL